MQYASFFNSIQSNDVTMANMSFSELRVKFNSIISENERTNFLWFSTLYKEAIWCFDITPPHAHIYVLHTISFQNVFIRALKIVIDSWKFTMLLLYILWDDWPSFMISASNEQLQQQLEYTLLKPDSHSWWISKMQSDTLEEQYAIKLCFKLGKNAMEMYGMLQTAFRPSCMNWASVSEWHKRFNEGRQSVRDDERCGRSKEVNTPELIGQRVRVTVRDTMLRF